MGIGTDPADEFVEQDINMCVRGALTSLFTFKSTRFVIIKKGI